MKNKDGKDKNVIHFSTAKKKKALKDIAVKKSDKTQSKLKAKLEAKYRAEYRAAQAKELGNAARRTYKSSSNGKTPFINWDKIPPFTRWIMAAFLIVQLIMSFAIDPADKIAIIYYFGFVPAMYGGAVEWSWSALISPFTTLIIHSSWIHLGFNMAMMLVMGVFFEREFGAKRTAIFFILCGLAGNLAYLLLDFNSTVPVIGASGAISGLFAVTFTIMIERGLMGAEMQRRGSLPFILLWSTVIIGLGLISSDTSWQSHIGGFIGGAIIFDLWKKGKLRF